MTDPTLVPVAVACPCPGTPHDGDTVYLRPEPDLTGGVLIQRQFVEWSASGAKEHEVFAGLIKTFVAHGVDSATFTDEAGDTLDRDATVALILSKFTLGKQVADKADELYSNLLLDPLLEQVSKSSRTSQTNGSTSVNKRSSTKRRKPSKSSSMPTSPTEDTAAA